MMKTIRAVWKSFDREHLIVPLFLVALFSGLFLFEHFLKMNILPYNIQLARYGFSESVLNRPSISREDFFKYLQNDRSSSEAFYCIYNDFRKNHSEVGGEVFLSEGRIVFYQLQTSHLGPYLKFLASDSDSDLKVACDAIVKFFGDIGNLSELDNLKYISGFLMTEAKFKIAKGEEKAKLRMELISMLGNLYNKGYQLPSFFERMRAYYNFPVGGKYLGEFHVHFNGGSPSEPDLLKHGTQFLISYLGGDSCEVYEYRGGIVIAKVKINENSGGCDVS